MLFSELPQSRNGHETSCHLSLPHGLKSHIHAFHFLTLEYPWAFYYCFPPINYSLFDVSFSLPPFPFPPRTHSSNFSLFLDPFFLNTFTCWKANFFPGHIPQTPFTPHFHLLHDNPSKTSILELDGNLANILCNALILLILCWQRGKNLFKVTSLDSALHALLII